MHLLSTQRNSRSNSSPPLLCRIWTLELSRYVVISSAERAQPRSSCHFHRGHMGPLPSQLALRRCRGGLCSAAKPSGHLNRLGSVCSLPWPGLAQTSENILHVDALRSHGENPGDPGYTSCLFFVSARTQCLKCSTRVTLRLHTALPGSRIYISEPQEDPS